MNSKVQRIEDGVVVTSVFRWFWVSETIDLSINEREPIILLRLFWSQIFSRQYFFLNFFVSIETIREKIFLLELDQRMKRSVSLMDHSKWSELDRVALVFEAMEDNVENVRLISERHFHCP